MAKYWEMECLTCGAEWEVYARAESDGDGGYELIPVSDGPGNMTSTECPACGEQGETL